MQPLYAYLSERLKSEDLELLAAGLKVDFEDLGGSTKTLKLLNLQQYLGNRSRLNEFLVQLRLTRPDLDLKDYLYLVIAEAFPTEEAITRLLHHFGFTVRNFGGSEKFSWGSEAWREQKAQALQDYMATNNRTDDLLSTISQLNPSADLSFLAAPETPVPTRTGSKTTQDIGRLSDLYVNFDIQIGRLDATTNAYPLNVVQSPAGELEQTIWQPFPANEIKQLVTFLRGNLGEPQEAEALGEALRNFLFPQPIWNLYNSSLARMEAGGKQGLRIRLRIGADTPELSQIPWEYCYDDRSFMALNKNTPLVRYIPTGRPPDVVTAPSMLRILLAMASPKDNPTIDIAAEEAWVRQGLTPLINQQKVELKVISPATPQELRRAIRLHDPHILHFLGHGIVQNNGQGALLLENGIDGNSRALSAREMLVLLQSSSVKVVLLSACLSATGGHSSQKAIMGVAPSLVWAGIPAVIAMQFKVPYQTAATFAQSFYEFLCHGEPIDVAATEARISAFIDDAVNWAIPVLFMRSPDGMIWQQKS